MGARVWGLGFGSGVMGVGRFLGCWTRVQACNFRGGGLGFGLDGGATSGRPEQIED